MVPLKKQRSILSGILSGCGERVTKCQFLIKATLSEASAPFNAQLNDGEPRGQSAYHSLLCQLACVDLAGNWRRTGVGGGLLGWGGVYWGGFFCVGGAGFGEIGPAGGADSAEGRRKRGKEGFFFFFFNFLPLPPCASNHSPDNPRRLITIATHLLPDIALSVSDTRKQVRINRPTLGCCLYYSMANLRILSPPLASANERLRGRTGKFRRGKKTRQNLTVR